MGSLEDPNASSLQQRSATALLANYKLGKTLGRGSFGKVKVAEHIVTGHKVAIKILNREKIASMDMEEKVRREIKISALFNHPHVIRLYEVVKTATDIYVVIEYVKGGELFDYIVEKGRLLEEEARHFFQQIIAGLEYCHRNMVVHRDLKPENLLLDTQAHVKLADFGLSNVMRDGHFLKTSCGSPNYAAPEVISGRLYAGPEVDVWSCGVILYALLCGSLPFDDENIPNLFKKIKNGMYTLPQHLSAGARDLIPRLLQVDPLKRITIAEIRQHPWFTAFLPRYLAVMQAEPVVCVRVDKEVLARCTQYGYNQAELVAALNSHTTTPATVAYFLELDHKQQSSAHNEYLSHEMNEGGVPQSQHPWGIMMPDGARRPGELQQRLLVEPKWCLGVRSLKRPQHIYHDLHAAFLACGLQWKRTGPYNFRCRAHIPTATSGLAKASIKGFGEAMDEDTSGGLGASSPVVAGAGNQGTPVRRILIRFEVQVYRARAQQYIVDVQRLEGPLYLYFELCSDLLGFLASRSTAAPAHLGAAGMCSGP